MPAGLIEQQHGMRTGGDFGCDLIEMKLHGFAVAGRQHQAGAGAVFGTHRAEQIGRLRSLIVDRAGT